MAIIPLHKAITKEVLRAAGFSERAAERAAIANARVDEKQGNDASEANLHAMLGYVSDQLGNLPAGPRLQTEKEAKQQVEALLTAKADRMVTAVLQTDFLQALDLLGAALHTVQDRAFHGFEPWPYAGITDAIRNDPNYMFAHGVRDLGGVSRLDVRTRNGGVGIAAAWTFQLSDHAYLSAQGFTNPQARSSARDSRPLGSPGGDVFEGTGGLLTLSFGAAPGSLPTRGSGQPGTEQASANMSIVTQGPAARAAAKIGSQAFVEDVSNRISSKPNGNQAWSRFLQFGR
jgi:hypothetical protein